MKLKQKIGIITFSLLAAVSLTVFGYSAYATDTQGSSGGTSGSSTGGGTSSGACIWRNDAGHTGHYPYTYMFDVVKRKKGTPARTSGTAKDYTRIASAIVGAEANSSNLQYSAKSDSSSPRSNPKKIVVGASDTVDKVEDIKGLAGLAKYLNKHHDVGDIGTQLSDDQVWEMLVDFGVAVKHENGSYDFSSDYANKFKDEQSDSITADYGYRILIQEFHMYTKPCDSSGTNYYALRKESQDMRDAQAASSGNDGDVYDLKLGDRKVLTISKYTESDPGHDYNALKDMMNGAGYNAIWLKQDIFSQYKCEHVQHTKCRILKKRGSGDWTTSNPNVTVEEPSANCNDYNTESSEYDGHTFIQNGYCPTISYECKAKSDEYGKCNMIEYIKKPTESLKKTNDNPEPVNCNRYSDREETGTYKYDGVELTNKRCPFKPKYNYDTDVVCDDCDSTTEKGSYQIQDVADWEAIIHSLKRNDKPNLQSYYKANSNGKILCREEFNIAFPNARNVKNVKIQAGRYFYVDEKGTKYVNGIYNFQPLKVTRTRQCIYYQPGTSTDIKETLSNYSNNHQIKTADKFGTINLKYKEKTSADKYGHNFKEGEALAADPTRIQQQTKNKASTIKIDSKFIDSGTYQVVTDQSYAYFKLPANTYQYIAIGTITINGTTYESGESKRTMPTDTSKFRKLSKENLPLAFNNASGVEISLKYNLPNSKLSGLIEDGNANTLETTPTEKNTYSKGASAGLHTACANMYTKGSKKYQTCVAARKEILEEKERPAKITYKNDAANTCLSELKSSADYKYKCEVQPCNDDNTCTVEPQTNGTRKYICKDGNECSENVFLGINYQEGISCDENDGNDCAVHDENDPATYTCKDGSDCSETVYKGEVYIEDVSCEHPTNKICKVNNETSPTTYTCKDGSNCSKEVYYGLEYQEGVSCEEPPQDCNTGCCEYLGADGTTLYKCKDGKPCEQDVYNGITYIEGKSCPNPKVCYPIASSNENKYICKDGTVCDEDVYRGIHGKYDPTKSCDRKCYIDKTSTPYKYYGQGGTFLGSGTDGKTKYEKECPSDECTDPDDPLCCDKCKNNDPGGVCNYCCPDTDMVCPDPLGNGECGCPGTVGSTIIYRTIDLTNPFPGQFGSNFNTSSTKSDSLGRNTGANWCYKNITTGKMNCKNNNGTSDTKTNSTVYNDIKKNRGVVTENVYAKTPVYSFTLTSETIKKIRSENKGKSYNDANYLVHNKTNDSYTSWFIKSVSGHSPIISPDSNSTCGTQIPLQRNSQGKIQCAEE